MPNLRAVSSYYSSNIFSNPEGDTNVSDEGAQGLGNKILFALFGALFDIVQYHPTLPTPQEQSALHPDSERMRCPTPTTSKPTAFPWDPGEKQNGLQAAMTNISANIQNPDVEQELDEEEEEDEHVLISLLPDPGYFLAGGIAGAISRTATAPLDRIKVYLIAQTSVSKDVTAAAKSGAPIKAAKTTAKPLAEACKALWNMGGIKSLFAGMPSFNSATG